jgi:signal transduction histidine kinase/DNA-binding response OmpR family regulator
LAGLRFSRPYEGFSQSRLHGAVFVFLFVWHTLIGMLVAYYLLSSDMKRAAVYFLFLLSSLLTVPALAQQHQIDSLENLLAHAPEDTNRVLLLNALSFQYKNWGSDPEKTKFYAEQNLKLANKLQFTFGIAQGHNALGNYYYTRNQNPEALREYEKALAFYQKAGRKRGMSSIQGNIAMVSEDLGDYSKAMEYYLNSMRIAEEIGDQPIIGNNLNNIGILMLNQQKYDDALKYLFKALPVHDITGDKRNKVFALNAIGVVYQERQQYDQALLFLKKSLQLCDSIQLERGKTNVYNNLGIVNLGLRQYDPALAYFQKALALSEKFGANQSNSIALNGIADVYRQTGKADQSIGYYRKALQLAETNQLIKNKLSVHEGLMQAYDQLKDYRQAFQHQSVLLALKDSIFSQENDRKIAQLEAAYLVEKKQAEMALLQKDQEREIWVRNTLLAGLLALLVITGLVVNRQRLKIRQNRLLVEKSQEIAEKNTQLEKQASILAAQSEQLGLTNEQLSEQSAQLAQQTHQLQELDRVKSRFFTNISHEFRTPLTLILAPLEKLKAGQTTAEQVQSQYGLIERNARHLLNLINQLLDFSKLEAGSMKIHLVSGDIHQRLKVLTYSFASLAESKNIHLEFVSAYRTIQAQYDPDVLEKIVNNLLSNAFKFTPSKGKVRVSVFLQKDQTDAAWQLELTVSDTGKGIPAEQLDQIFDRFYQVDGSQVREQEGTGIGLALVRELVEVYQGALSVRSEVGQGSEFKVRLPLPDCHFEIKDSTEPEEQFVSESEPVRGSQSPEWETLSIPESGREIKPLMLLVEDNTEVREFIRESFGQEFRVIEAINGAGGLEAARKEIPDLIITDRMMPGMDGVELCRQLKTDERTSHIPVVMLTAKATEQSRIEGLETGADDYILKPFSVQELKVRVINLIEQRKKLRERFSREVKLQPKDIAITSSDEVFLNKAIGLVEAHMSDTDFSVETFVHEIGMSRVQLHRKLKALTDQSTSEFIRSIRLKRAASLIEQQYGNIADVMYEVGFNNVSYFASNFKKMFGVNPSEYLSKEVSTQQSATNGSELNREHPEEKAAPVA